nr:hypothetical protein [Tanacetum cinerariifolium]
MAQEKELTELEARRKQQIDQTRAEYTRCIEMMDNNLPITKFKYHTDKSSKKKSLIITRNHQPLNYKVKETAEKLKIPPPYHLTTTELTPTEKERKRTKELVKQVFLNKEVVVDEMERNLAHPLGVTIGNHGQLLEHPKLGILFFNTNTDLGFQGISECELATTIQLLMQFPL